MPKQEVNESSGESIETKDLNPKTEEEVSTDPQKTEGSVEEPKESENVQRAQMKGLNLPLELLHPTSTLHKELNR